MTDSNVQDVGLLKPFFYISLKGKKMLYIILSHTLSDPTTTQTWKLFQVCIYKATKAPSPTKTAATRPPAMLNCEAETALDLAVLVADAAAAAAAEASEASPAETEEAEAKIPAKAVEAADKIEVAAAVSPAAARAKEVVSQCSRGVVSASRNSPEAED